MLQYVACRTHSKTIFGSREYLNCDPSRIILLSMVFYFTMHYSEAKT